MYFGREATKAALQREHLAGYRVLHLATHAVIDERVPARSGVVLSGSSAEDGILRVTDVFNLVSTPIWWYCPLAKRGLESW